MKAFDDQLGEGTEPYDSITAAEDRETRIYRKKDGKELRLFARNSLV